MGIKLRGNLDQFVHQAARRFDRQELLLIRGQSSGERSRQSHQCYVEEAAETLAFHGAPAPRRPGLHVTIVKSLDPKAGDADLWRARMTLGLLHLISKTSSPADNAKNGGPHRPLMNRTITSSTRDLGNKASEIAIRDNGTGIPDEVRLRCIESVLTTNPLGTATGPELVINP